MLPVQIFISYARDDDAVPPDSPAGLKGFVTYLEEQLEYEFEDCGPPRPKLWRDQRGIERREQFEPRIEKNIKASSILLVVLSRNWLARPWCRRELDSFEQRWSAEDELGIRGRIVVVAKHTTEQNDRPSLLQGQEGYSFFALEEQADAGQESEFFVRGQPVDPRYMDLVKVLGRDLWRMARRITHPASVAPAPQPSMPSAPSDGRTVYLAKPAGDMRQAYDRLVKELQGRGFAVVPPSGAEIPHDASAPEFVDESMKKAELSVHLLGERLGYAPEDAEPIVKLQLACAAAHVPAITAGGGVTSRSFRRIIWAPKLLEDPAFSAERDPFDVLGRFTRQLPTDKVEGNSLTKFVDFLIQHLDLAAPPREKPDETGAGAHKIYVYHSPEDEKYAGQLGEAFQLRQVTPEFPVLEGEARERAERHQKTLEEYDAVVVCWGAATEVWARAAADELKNWRHLGRPKQFASCGLVAGPPANRRKTFFTKFPLLRPFLDLTAHEHPPPGSLDPLFGHARPNGS